MSLDDDLSARAGPPPALTPQDDADDLARLLREVRETQGVSVAELARRTGVTPSQVLDFEAGRVIPARTPFADYMRALGYPT